MFLVDSNSTFLGERFFYRFLHIFSTRTYLSLNYTHHKHIKIRTQPTQSPIYNGILYVGDKADAANCVRLQNLGITHIVNATKDIPNSSPNRFKYINVAVDDDESTDLKRHFRRSNEFVKNAIRKGGRVMIHCRAGVSRSVTLCIAYLMQCEGMRLRDAFSLLESRRSIIRPNNSFLMQLAKYEVMLYKTSSVSQCTDVPWNFPEWFLFRATLPSNGSVVVSKKKKKKNKNKS